MHYAILGLLALVSEAMAGEVTPPDFFVLRTKLRPAQTNKGAFDNLYMIPNENPATTLDAVFYPSNSAGFFYTLEKTKPPKADSHTFYSLRFNNTSSGPVYRAQMRNEVAFYANWQPMAFVETTSAGNGEEESGFYINGTGSNAHLLWTNNYSDPPEGDFTSWLSESFKFCLSRLTKVPQRLMKCLAVCDWWFGLPQLFFVTVYAPPVSFLKLPSTCAAVILEVIPLIK